MPLFPIPGGGTEEQCGQKHTHGLPPPAVTATTTISPTFPTSQFSRETKCTVNQPEKFANQDTPDRREGGVRFQIECSREKK